jgi:hypothetical protein
MSRVKCNKLLGAQGIEARPAVCAVLNATGERDTGMHTGVFSHIDTCITFERSRLVCALRLTRIGFEHSRLVCALMLTRVSHRLVCALRLTRVSHLNAAGERDLHAQWCVLPR